MHFRTFVRELFASTWTRNHKCRFSCFALQCGSVLVSKRENHAYVRARSLPESMTQLFSVMSQNNSIQHATVRSTFESCVPLNNGSSLSSMARTSKIPPVPVSSVVEAISVLSQLTPAGEVRFDLLCSRMYQSRRCSH